MFKKFLLSIFLLFVFVLPAVSLAAEKVNIYVFESETCPHCAKEEAFLKTLKEEMGDKIEIKDFEISENSENIELLQKIGKNFSLDISHIPFTIIGNKYLTGYAEDSSTGETIRNLVNECLAEQECPDLIKPLIIEKIEQPENGGISEKILEKITLPVIGEINIKEVSLPLLSIIIGAIDGFNPCAMWVLVFLITLLLGMKDRKRMWILGSAFILASGAVYFLFLTAWLNLFLFLGFVFWVRILIGLVAIFSGIYYLKKYFTDRAAVCQISESKRQRKIFEKLKKIVAEKSFWLALIGIILLAAFVNLFELLCSAGLPAIYTNVLSMSQLSPIQYYSLLLLYILVFMLDDMLIFVIAMVTLKTVTFTKKYSNISALLGGVAITIIGLLLLFRPEWLMF